MEGRIPPHSLEAEQSVLGAILLDYQVLDEIEGLLPTPEAFYAEAHRKIYAAMQGLRAEGSPVDLVTLAEELSRRGELDGVGGISYLMQLSEATPTAAYAEHYARIVAEKWTLRRLIQAAGEAMRLAYEEAGSLDEILDQAGKRILEVATVPLGTVPIYEAEFRAARRKNFFDMSADELFQVIEEHGKEGVDYITVHVGVTLKNLEVYRNSPRTTGIVSRGGGLMAAWMLHRGEENPLYARFDDLLPRDHAPVVRKLAQEVDKALAGFVRGQVSVCMVLGAYYATGLMLAGLQFGLVIGAIAGAMTVIPYIGALVGGALAIGFALYQFWGDWVSLGIIAAVFALGQFVEGNILTPRLVGKSVGLHPVWLMFALSLFGGLFGIAGMLVAVPISAAIGVFMRFGIGQYKDSLLYRGHGPQDKGQG